MQNTSLLKTQYKKKKLLASTETLDATRAQHTAKKNRHEISEQPLATMNHNQRAGATGKFKTMGRERRATSGF